MKYFKKNKQGSPPSVIGDHRRILLHFLCPLNVFWLPKTFKLFGFQVPEKCYYRNASWALNVINVFVFKQWKKMTKASNQALNDNKRLCSEKFNLQGN